MGRYICSEYMLIVRSNQNRPNTLVYSLDMDHQSNLVDMYMIRHFLVLYILHLHHMVKAHMGLDIRPLMELKYGFQNMNLLTNK